MAPARLFRSALGDSSLSPRIRFQSQYNAACAALLCADGRVEKGAEPPNFEGAGRLRKQALAWLNANLVMWKRVMKSNAKARAPGIKQLRHWLSDPDLATVRNAGRLTELSSEDRAAWAKLWREVRDAIGPVVARRPKSSATSNPTAK